MNDLALAARPRRLAELPTPAGRLPVLGHLTRLDKRHFHQQLERWLAEIGGSPFRVDLGGTALVIWSDAERIQQVLRERPQRFRRTSRLGSVLGDFGTPGLFAAEGEAWAPQRRLIMQALNATHFRGFYPTLKNITERLLARWRRAAESGELLDMTAELMRYTVDVSSSLSFGENPNTLEREGDRIQQHLAYIFPEIFRRILTPVSYWHWFKLPRDRRLDREMAAVGEYVRATMERARQRLRAQPGKDPANVLEAMLALVDQPGSEFTDDLVAANVTTLLLAGEDTTANALAWTMPFLAADPTLQRAMAVEADTALGGDAVCPDFDTLRRLDRFEALSMEAIRLKPVIGFLGFEPNEDVMVGDLLLPKGTRNLALFRPEAKNPRHFANPERYDPARWLRGRGDAGHDAHEPRAFLQFGAGPRVCPGRHLATVEMRLVLSMLLKHFEVRLECDPAEIEEVSALTVTPSKMPIRLVAR